MTLKLTTAALAILATISPALSQSALAPQAQTSAMDSWTFRQMAAASDIYEIEAAKLAIQRSRSPAIRRLASMILRDHQATYAALNGGSYASVSGPVSGSFEGARQGEAAAGPLGAITGAAAGAVAGTASLVTSPFRPASQGGLDARHAEMLNQLAAATGRNFDQLYRRQQINAHMEAIALYRSYAQNSWDQGLANFARQALSSLEMHLAMAQRGR